MTVALRGEGIVADLGGVRILDGVSVAVEPGAWVSIVGPNGAGKTTLIRVLSGALRPQAGRIEIGNDDVTKLRARERARRIALVPQTPVVPIGVTALDYVLLGRTPHLPFFGSESNDDLEIAHGTLGRLGVGDLAGRDVESCSGGERQRIFLARALAQQAPILLLDEPTTALDIGHQQEVLDLVDGLRAEHGIAVVSTMHDLTLAGLYADELVLLGGGRVVERGPASAVLTEDSLRRHFGARVSVLPGAHGPVVVPHRAPANGAGEAPPAHPIASG
ncbi:MAG TPA: ABC transporter ATP-binding protein [Acidimicrobiia bacterium]|nr:ABC transporter ATP-binding protein [Acidimicrobiia bacterium]